MKNLLLTIVLVASGCSQQLPTAPTQEAPATIRTSRVNPSDYDLNGYTLEHDPNADGVSLCRTKLREYCTADGSRCDWVVDLYTVMRPEVCPLEPIE